MPETWLFRRTTLLLLASVGCGDPEAPPSPEDPADAARSGLRQNLEAFEPAGGAGTLSWRACSLGGRYPAQCADAEVPLDWYDLADARRVRIHLVRLEVGTPAAQVWILPGGPLPISAQAESAARTFEALGRRGDVNVRAYLVNFRGFAPGTAFECPMQRALDSPGGARIEPGEVPACAEVLDRTVGLTGFSTTQLAADVVWLARHTGDRLPIYLRGHSYGGTAIRRMLQIDPAVAEAVWISGSADISVLWNTIDAHLDAVARRLFDKCAAAPACRARLGDDPEALAGSVLARLDLGHCPEAGFTAADVRWYVGEHLLRQPALHALIPALFFRLDRCGPADIPVLAHLRGRLAVEALPEPPAVEDLAFTEIQMQLFSREGWSAPIPPLVDMIRFEGETLAFNRSGPRARLLRDLWPTPEVDPATGRIPREPYDALESPIRGFGGRALFTHGELDTQAPVGQARALADRFFGEARRFVEWPGGTHNARPARTDGIACEVEIFARFFNDPDLFPPACVDDPPDTDFAGRSDVRILYLGSDDLYD